MLNLHIWFAQLRDEDAKLVEVMERLQGGNAVVELVGKEVPVACCGF
jgi:hypothetical protein